jgi:hypothetical protein
MGPSEWYPHIYIWYIYIYIYTNIWYIIHADHAYTLGLCVAVVLRYISDVQLGVFIDIVHAKITNIILCVFSYFADFQIRNNSKNLLFLYVDIAHTITKIKWVYMYPLSDRW